MADNARDRPRQTQRRRAVVRAADEFDAAAANSEKSVKLRLNGLRRDARSRGLELRHSAYGYSLVDVERQRVDGRSDLTLDEVAAQLGVG
jgi:chromosome segregation and condensation protein ScpB